MLPKMFLKSLQGRFNPTKRTYVSDNCPLVPVDNYLEMSISPYFRMLCFFDMAFKLFLL